MKYPLGWAIGFVLLVLSPLLLWQLSVGGDDRAPLAVASFLSAIAALAILRDEATGRRLATVSAVTVFFFVVALATVQPRRYADAVEFQYEHTAGSAIEYEEHPGITDLAPADSAFGYGDPAAIHDGLSELEDSKMAEIESAAAPEVEYDGSETNPYEPSLEPVSEPDDEDSWFYKL
jgi:hypothetical protein